MNFDDVKRLMSGMERHIVLRSSPMILSSNLYTSCRVTNVLSLFSIGA